jgi:NifU-like protein involved in Fe-S cluster formation
MTTELLIGRTLAEAAALRDEDVVIALGGLPRNKMHCSVLAEDVIQAVLDDYHRRYHSAPAGAAPAAASADPNDVPLSPRERGQG